MCRGTPNASIFCNAFGRADSLDAVENARTHGSFTAFTNRRIGMRTTDITTPSTSTTNTINAQYNVSSSLPKFTNTPTPLLPSVTAIAAPTPNGARYITYAVYLNITSESDSQNFTTGCALLPSAAHAAPKRKQNTTTCSTSPRAIESIRLVGKACSSTSVNVGGLVEAIWGAAALSMRSPAPGRTRFT